MFLISSKDPHALYMNSGGLNQIHHSIVLSNISPVNYGGVAYYRYMYQHALDINDCLQFAESLTIGEPNYSGKKCILKNKSSGLVFGYSDANNIRIATTASAVLNERANPEIGETYAIVRQKVAVGYAPYHIAHVIFKDGNMNITVEADAGNPDLKQPVFDMYSTDPTSGGTFHDTYKKMYAPASTIVLDKR